MINLPISEIILRSKEYNLRVRKEVTDYMAKFKSSKNLELDFSDLDNMTKL